MGSWRGARRRRRHGGHRDRGAGRRSAGPRRAAPPSAQAAAVKAGAAALVSVSPVSLSQSAARRRSTARGPSSSRTTSRFPPPRRCRSCRQRSRGPGGGQGDVAIFTPAKGYPAGTHVTVTVAGLGYSRNRSESSSFKTASYSTLRLQEILAQLGYLPLTWTPAAGAAAPGASAAAQLSAAYAPPAGNLPVGAGVPGAAPLVLVAGRGEHPRPGGRHRLRGRPRAAHRRAGGDDRVAGAADGRRQGPAQRARVQLRDRQQGLPGDADHLA